MLGLRRHHHRGTVRLSDNDAGFLSRSWVPGNGHAVRSIAVVLYRTRDGGPGHACHGDPIASARPQVVAVVVSRSDVDDARALSVGTRTGEAGGHIGAPGIDAHINVNRPQDLPRGNAVVTVSGHGVKCVTAFALEQAGEWIAENSIRLHGAVLVNAVIEQIERLIHVGDGGLAAGLFPCNQSRLTRWNNITGLAGGWVPL